MKTQEETPHAKKPSYDGFLICGEEVIINLVTSELYDTIIW